MIKFANEALNEVSSSESPKKPAGVISGSKETIQWLKNLKSGDVLDKIEAIKQLGKIKDNRGLNKFLIFIAHRLSDENKFVRTAAMRVLADSGMYRNILPLLEDVDSDVRYDTAMVLSDAGKYVNYARKIINGLEIRIPELHPELASAQESKVATMYQAKLKVITADNQVRIEKFSLNDPEALKKYSFRLESVVPMYKEAKKKDRHMSGTHFKGPHRFTGCVQHMKSCENKSDTSAKKICGYIKSKKGESEMIVSKQAQEVYDNLLKKHAGTFVKISKLSPEEQSFLRQYWTQVHGANYAKWMTENF